MSFIVIPLIYLINTVLNIFFYVVIAHTILNWLFAFGIINTYNPVVNRVADGLHQITEPFLKPVRAFIPQLAGIDFSPLVVLLAVEFLQRMLGMISLKLAGV